MENKLKFKIRSLKKTFGTNHVLKGIDLDVIKDSSLIILGGSGTGKSVLIKLMVGLLAPDEGSILYDGQESVNMSHSARKRMLEDCGYLFQAGALFDSLSVQQNIVFFAEKLSPLTKGDKRDLAAKKLESVGLSSKILDLYPSELSGGMQKRVSLARTICVNPKVIFFDEPTTGLDPIMSNVINDLIIKIQEELGATTISITHDMQSARRIGKEVAFLFGGQIVWSGKIEDLDHANNEDLRQFITGDTSKVGFGV